ncbi:MAG TPA: glycosyltransferase, partial [Candidatus Nitrosotenuis sp.]|nr:glycosyltransferase [Candidatus Nitrosotenuis sp.]
NGIRAARGRVILFIDDDVLADRRLLEEHLRSHQADERIVVNGWVNHVSRPERPAAPRFTLADISTSFFWTSNVSVKRRHLLECGLFDEDFKEYGWEDQEIGLRLMAIGLRARNNYRAVGYHVKRPPRKADLPRMLAQAEAKARTAALYVRKHRRLRTRLSTGTYPPRLVLDRLAGSLGLLEAFCRRRLARPGLGEQDELHGLDAWCARQLVNLRYYGTVRRELAKHPL